MSSTSTDALLKAIGAVVAALVLLSVVGTIVSVVMGVVATVVSLVLSLIVLGVIAWAVLGLISFFTEDSGSSTGYRGEPWDDTVSRTGGWRDHLPGRTDSTASGRADPADRLRERYVAGDIDEAEFERRMDRLLERDSADSAGRNVGSGRSRSRDRNWER
ncbi:SHOCT domain-containing protein [Halostella sp. JP-L12]|uniref:SHOCT domain-containing protein n=1 Tax=Halostella TaxID=1843185 RepID=UPI000EF79C8A|nr:MULTISPECIES: SHOCT domain-containing protein [Halostella]NHN48632.1 SHOCT domain-containing protein [Halostella sp. JP-L12]